MKYLINALLSIQLSNSTTVLVCASYETHYCMQSHKWMTTSQHPNFPFHIASTAMPSTSLLNKSIILFLDTTHFRTQKRMEKANSSAGLVQSSCFRGGFKACHRTSCIVNSTASMADWWAICLLDCLAPGPWSYVYVWALLFHMYRPQIIFCPPPPSSCFSLAELMAYA